MDGRVGRKVGGGGGGGLSRREGGRENKEGRVGG